MPRGRCGYGPSVEVLTDGIGHHGGPVAPGNGCVELVAEIIVEGHGDAHGHVRDTISGTAADTITSPTGVAQCVGCGASPSLMIGFSPIARRVEWSSRVVVAIRTGPVNRSPRSVRQQSVNRRSLSRWASWALGPSANLLSASGGGHAANGGSPCVPEHVTLYLVELRVPGGQAC
jgi:hypothetical protein